MLHMYINTYCKAQMKEFYRELATADLNEVLMPDVTYITVENERHEKLFVFIVLGKATIHENIPSVDEKQITINGRTWVAILSSMTDAGIYIEIPPHIYMMLDIIKDYEQKGMEFIRSKIAEYCRMNQVHNYANDYIVN
mgnify:CR=1 FL=1